MKKLLLSALIGITSLTAISDAKANLSDDYNMDSYVKKACMEKVKQGARASFFVDVVEPHDDKKILNFYQVYGKNVYKVGSTTYERGQGITDQRVCKEVKFVQVLSKVNSEYVSGYSINFWPYYVSGGYFYTQFELENNMQELVKYVKRDEEKTERYSFTRFDIYAQSLE